MSGDPLKRLPAAPPPLTAERVADALVDNLGGFDVGWALFRAALATIALAVERAQESEFPFTAHPNGVWRKLAYGVEDGIRLALVACELEELRHGEGDDERNAPARRADVARLLHERAVERARARQAWIG